MALIGSFGILMVMFSFNVVEIYYYGKRLDILYHKNSGDFEQSINEARMVQSVVLLHVSSVLKEGREDFA